MNWQTMVAYHMRPMLQIRVMGEAKELLGCLTHCLIVMMLQSCLDDWRGLFQQEKR